MKIVVRRLKTYINPEITEQILDAIEAADLDVDQQDKLEEEFAERNTFADSRAEIRINCS